MTERQKKQDKIELCQGALIQHGPLSNRIYLMKLNQADPKLLIPAMEELAAQNDYTKIFAKVSFSCADMFLSSGYLKEAEIPEFYNGQDAAVFLGRYFDLNRRKESNSSEIEDVLKLALSKSKQKISPVTMISGAVLRQCSEDDAKKMCEVYREVFKSYPFPIDDPRYIINTMRNNIIYYCIEIDDKFVSLASAEMDVSSKTVEMTDFATLPEFRGNKFAYHLLLHMEKEMKKRDIKMAYTIARAVSAGMNITFAKAGYDYGGRLINNTNIAGQIESMNIWYKKL